MTQSSVSGNSGFAVLLKGPKATHKTHLLSNPAHPASPTPTKGLRACDWFLCPLSVAVETRRYGPCAHGAVPALLPPGRARLSCGALLQGRALPTAGHGAHLHPSSAGGLPEPR